MEKRKITRKELKGFKNIISVGYCSLNYLLMYKDANFYNTGVYGWNYDVYVINSDTLIVTGYRPVKGNIKPDYSVIDHFEQEAQNIYNNLDINFENKKKEIEKILNRFIEVCLY